MSRARDIADFNASLFADDEISGNKLASTLDLSSKTLTLPDDVDGGQGLIVNSRSYNSGYGSGARLGTSSASWSTLQIGGTNKDSFAPSDNSNIRSFVKRRNDTHLRIKGWVPTYNSNGQTGHGMRVRMVLSNTSSVYNSNTNYFTVGLLSDGMAKTWGMAGYGGATAAVSSFYYDTAHGGGTAQSTSDTANVLAYTGTLHWYVQCYVHSNADTVYFIDYGGGIGDNQNPKYATFTIEEYIA